MEPLKHWKIILSLAAIFMAGAVTGGVITFQVVRQVVRTRTNPEQWPGRVLRDYQHRLHLAPDQQERIRPILSEAGRKMQRNRAEYIKAHADLLHEVHSTLVHELTPAQSEIFEEIRREQMQRFRDRGTPPGKRPFPGNQRPDSMSPRFGRDGPGGSGRNSFSQPSFRRPGSPVERSAPDQPKNLENEEKNESADQRN
jgi:hypothetical protein